MLTKKQVIEIRELLNNSANPLFLFDNDPDGLCSFLLLQKYIGRGKGFPIKSFPDLNESYFKRAMELNADSIFILDKPLVSEDFFKRIQEVNMPVVWIDHHKIDKNDIPSFVNYYNPVFNKKKSEEPVTALCYQINSDKNLSWIAVAGSISDRFFPKFYKNFKEKFSDLAINSKDAFDIFYNSQIGKIARIFSFGLKDSTTNVINMMKFLIKIKTPYEVLEDSSQNHSMHIRFEQIESKYQKLLKKAIEFEKNSDKFLFFQYSGTLSISSDLSNELAFRFPQKNIIVMYVSGIKANVSARGKGIREKILDAIKNLNGATGGGHEDATGAQIRTEDIDLFKKNLEKQH